MSVSTPVVSIIVCTKNRAASLQSTLMALSGLSLPAALPTELIIVDNGSTDNTRAVLSRLQESIPYISCTVLNEPQPGKSNALNRAVAAAQGSILLFTDDDVRPPHDWIERMTQPILEGRADAVAGGVRLATSLHRPWLGAEQRSWLASTEDLPRDATHPLIGANMAVSKQVFLRVPSFDPEVNVEDTLFWLQLREAGFRIITQLDVEVEHHLDEKRLSWQSFAKQAQKRGEFAAYGDYHWNHVHRRHPYLALVQAWLRLWFVRLLHPLSWRRGPTMPGWEMQLLEMFHIRRHILIERRRRRNYEKFGLVKITGLLPTFHNPDLDSYMPMVSLKETDAWN